jgi:hypothetical protein
MASTLSLFCLSTLSMVESLRNLLPGA